MFDTIKSYGKQALVGGAMLGAGIGMAGNAQGASQTSPDAGQFMKNTDPNYHWNSEIGRYKPIQNRDGSSTYQTKQGNFKRIPSNTPSGFRFVRI